MAQKLSSYIVQLIQDACLKSFWYKRALKSFLRRHHITEQSLAPLAGEQKRDYLYWLFDELCKASDSRKYALVMEMGRDLASQTAFPDLANVENSDQKMSEAREAVRLLAAELRELDAKIEEQEERRVRREKAADLKAQTIRTAQTLKTLRDRFEEELVPLLGTR